MNQKIKREERVAHIIDIPGDYRLVVDDRRVDDPYHLLWWA